MSSRSVILATALLMLSAPLPAWSQSPQPTIQHRQEYVVDYGPRGQENLRPSTEIPTPERSQDIAPPARDSQTSAVPSVHEACLWRLLKAQRYAQLRLALRRIKQTHPTWRPPAKLLTLLHEGEARQRIGHAIQQQQWAEVITLSRRHSRLFSCQQIDFFWALAAAYHTEAQPQAVLSIYEQIIPGCRDSIHRLATLQKAITQLPPDMVESLFQREASVAKDSEAQNQFAEIRYQFSANRLVEETRAKAFAQALALAEHLGSDVQQRRDVKIATLLGWTYFQEHHLERAAAWFDQALTWDTTLDDAAYGLALVTFQQGDLPRAASLIRSRSTSSAKMRALFGEILSSQAAELHRQKQYAESLTLLQEGAQFQPARRDMQLLTAWNHYALGQTDRAGEEFAALYRSHPDEESAQGTFFSYARKNRWTELETLAHSVTGPLTPLWAAYAGQRYYDRKLFLLAAQTAPETFPQLQNIASPRVTHGVGFRHKSGAKGLGNLNIEKLPLADGILVYQGTHRFSLHLDRVTLDSDRLSANAPIGSFPIVPTAYQVRPTTRLEGCVEPSLAYAYEGWIAPYAEFGLGLSNGVVSSQPMWRLGVVTQGEEGNWGGEIFSQPVRESLLSYTGIVDPYTGKKWGRVLQTGGRFSLYRGLNEQWGFSGQAGAAWLSGKHVSDNYHLSLGASLARTFKLPGFEYIALGPRVTFAHYGKNLSQFTIGHGGYFSPSHLVQLVAAVNFLSQEGRRFVVTGDASVGFQTHHEDSSPFFPRDPDGRRYTARDSRSVVFSTELTGLLRLSDHWQIGGSGAVRKTASFDDTVMMVFAQFLFDPRPAVFTSDIPRSLLQALY